MGGRREGLLRAAGTEGRRGECIDGKEGEDTDRER